MFVGRFMCVCSQVRLDFFDGRPKPTALFYTFAISRYYLSAVLNLQSDTASQTFLTQVGQPIYLYFVLLCSTYH